MFIQIGSGSEHGFNQPLGLLQDCHRRIERFLHILAVTAEQAAGGPLTPRQQRDLEMARKYFATAARTHTSDEEESLFPRVRASSDPAAARASAILAHLEQDHRDADRRHAEVDALIRRWLTAGQLEPALLGALREHLSALQSTYREHIALEDHELFPLAARVLTPGEVTEIGGEMAARRGLS